MDAIQQAADKLKIQEAPVQEAKRSNPPQIEIALMREYDDLPTWDNDLRFWQELGQAEETHLEIASKTEALIRTS